MLGVMVVATKFFPKADPQSHSENLCISGL